MVHIFYRQLDFPSELGVANEILEKEASFIVIFSSFSENKLFLKKKSNLRLGSC